MKTLKFVKNGTYLAYTFDEEPGSQIGVSTTFIDRYGRKYSAEYSKQELERLFGVGANGGDANFRHVLAKPPAEIKCTNSEAIVYYRFLAEVHMCARLHIKRQYPPYANVGELADRVHMLEMQNAKLLDVIASLNARCGHLERAISRGDAIDLAASNKSGAHVQRSIAAIEQNSF